MIVNLCGFGWSGSGAFLDLLREYEETTFPTNKNWEFNLLWVPDGIYDLEQKLCSKHCRIFDSALAIDRFLAIAREYGGNNFHYDRILKKSFYEMCRQYIDELVQFQLEGNTVIHKLHPSIKDRIIYYYNRKLAFIMRNRISQHFFSDNLYDALHINNFKKMLISYNPDNFLDITQKFVSSILKTIRDDENKILVLDQSVPPDMPHLFDHYFKEEHKTIIVRRDPRDQFIIINRLIGNSRPVPTKIDDFISFYKRTVVDTRLPDSSTILSIQFEDLIYEYDKTVNRIESFLGLKKHCHQMKFFKPQVSINNTQLVNLFPEFSDNVRKIEDELKASLYTFEKYNFERNANRIF